MDEKLEEAEPGETRTATEGNPFEPFLGALPAFRPRAEINAWVRGLRDDEYEAELRAKEAIDGPAAV
jgi:hypothetical protein